MEKYKRLTISDLDIAEQFDNIKPENRNKFCLDCFSRLTELEDKIENGTLIELPCKVGDTLWEAERDCCGAWDIKVDKFEVFENNNIKILDKYENDYYVEDFGKTLFPTKAEAEKKIKELQNER